MIMKTRVMTIKNKDTDKYLVQTQFNSIQLNLNQDR